MACVGAGEQRYVFKLQSGTKPLPKESLGVVKRPSTERDLNVGWDRPLMNESTSLLGRFVQMVTPTPDIRYSMYWTYGSFLGEIPRRLGTSEALDTCVDALTSAHSDFSIGSRAVSAHTLHIHSRAIRAVRESLATSATVHTPETLCAVYLLLICQVFLNSGSEGRANHAVGAAQILKVRGYYDPQHEFERELLTSLRGPVLFTALCDDEISFDSDEWQTIIQSHLNSTTIEDQLLCCLARVPLLLKRGRMLGQGLWTDQNLVQDVRIQYELVKDALQKLYARFQGLEENPSTQQVQLARRIPLHALLQRSYGLGLMAVTIFNCMLSAIDVCNDELVVESTRFVEEVVLLARAAHHYRPLGASYMMLCLVFAWAATTDLSLRSSIMHEMISYKEDMRTDFSVQKLQQARDKLQFRTITSAWC